MAGRAGKSVGLVSATIDWTEVGAIAASVSAVGIIGVLAAAASARSQARQAVRSGRTQTLLELYRIWTSKEMVEARALSWNLSREGLSDTVVELRGNDPETYLKSERLPNFLNELGSLESVGAIDFRTLWLLFSSVVLFEWDAWEPAITEIRARTGTRGWFSFERLATKMKNPKELHRLLHRLPFRPSERRQLRAILPEMVERVRVRYVEGPI